MPREKKINNNKKIVALKLSEELHAELKEEAALRGMELGVFVRCILEYHYNTNRIKGVYKNLIPVATFR
jgi:predicted DNA binding CopG/RHH family protein